MERPPVDVKFESGLKSNQLPDISVWNYSCLVLSEAAKRVLDPVLKNIGAWVQPISAWLAPASAVLQSKGH